jgi:gluconate 5-dehydrogenase
MVPRGRGKIVNVCSVQAELARPGIASYAAKRAG